MQLLLAFSPTKSHNNVMNLNLWLKKSGLVCLAMLLSSLLLISCTEVELASHVAKQTPIMKPSQSQGKFKVGSPYRVKGKWYKPKETYSFEQTGIASWYGPNFHGKKTANGEIFDMYELTAAHKTLQIPSLIRVTNLENGKSIVARVNDRGPFSRGRVLDLSMKAAELLDFKNQGTAKVKIQVLSQESRQIAEAAKRGEDTRRYELAYNQMGQRQTISDEPMYVPTYKGNARQPTQSKTITASNAAVPAVETADIQTSVPGHIQGGKFYPDPVVENVPVKPTSIYIQAGAFRNQDNAQRLASSLQSFGSAHVETEIVGGSSLHRVRIGPLANVPEADRVLARMAAAGQKDAIVVVD